MSEKSKDCLSCRFVSGGGLILGGVYVVYHSKNVKKFSKISALIGYGLGALGLLRIFSLPPFRNSQIQKDDRAIDKTEQSEYIIERHPTKFQ